MKEEKNIVESKEIVKQDLSPEDIKILTEVGFIPKDCSAELVKLYSKVCAETQLNPYRKQIHFIRRGNSYTIQVGIDGYRSIADRTGLYAGSDDYAFDDEKTPNKAIVTVYKIVNGVRCPFTASARMSEYKPKEVTMQFMWNKMPNLMLGKCAEALALRKAFPNELSGTYTNEEMQQADVINIGGKSSEPPQKETNGENKISPTSDNRTFCQREGCGKVVTSPRVIAKSMERFGKVYCFPECQNIMEKEQFSVPEFEEDDIVEEI